MEYEPREVTSPQRTIRRMAYLEGKPSKKLNVAKGCGTCDGKSERRVKRASHSTSISSVLVLIKKTTIERENIGCTFIFHGEVMVLTDNSYILLFDSPFYLIY
ncbi:uncharacterized protein TM35_000052520 [Trypanosoma theileri]|uniref:Uncharacterized protein n=1 Tax=Trypanosoma theileri TaxID=67003 RepID=A0A1X0P402_9TRYP|nr:uncharacterized protein TM35_000052520 [Trypanosoma theileri]ORC91656.1 hypothetical protein TM35_000052520 [Trypanosoma theileri]